MVETVLVVLIVFMIVGALVAIETPVLLHSVISIGTVGFLLSIVFVFLSAPDLAITQIAVEVITLTLLLKATSTPRREADSAPWISWNKLGAIGMLLVLAWFGSQMFAELPEFGTPVMERFPDAASNTYLRDGLSATGAANLVSAVLLDFRGYDTLGEATVLFCAVMGALTVMRREAKKQRKESDEEDPT